MELQNTEQLSLFDISSSLVRTFSSHKAHQRPGDQKERVPDMEDSNTGKTIRNIMDTIPDYVTHLNYKGKSRHTIESFISDIRQLAGEFPDYQLSDYSLSDLKKFLGSCVANGNKPKTSNRKCIAIKNYFRFLQEENILSDNPAEALVCIRVAPPLPSILTREEVSAFFLSAHTPLEKTMALLLLGAGLKRSELVSLRKSNVDVSNPMRPAVEVNQGKRYKDRKVSLPLDFVESYKSYAPSVKEDMLFDFSEDHINIIVKQIAVRADIFKKVSCQILRDTYAVQCLKAGESIQEVLKKLGLAPNDLNKEIAEKYRLLLEKCS